MKATRRPPTAAAVSDQLRLVIAARQLTPTALARAADVAPSVVTRFLSGQRGRTLDTFGRIASARGLKLIEGPRRGGARPRADERRRPRPAEVTGGDLPRGEGPPGGTRESEDAPGPGA